MNAIQEKILEYLINHALGISNAISISNLANFINLPPKGSNNDDLRALLKDMVINHCTPIGTIKHGKYIVSTDAERKISSQFVDRGNRADAIRRNGNYIP